MTSFFNFCSLPTDNTSVFTTKLYFSCVITIYTYFPFDWNDSHYIQFFFSIQFRLVSLMGLKLDVFFYKV
jgi:hypothetical protein